MGGRRARVKLLMVVHDFLPASTAGVEVYVHDLARALLVAGEGVAVAHTVRGVGRAQYALQRSELDGLTTWQLVQNYPYRPMDEVVRDPQAERRFDEILAREAPDLVHVHHLWGWSAGLAARARAEGVPTVMHLHDHWLACPAGGQRRRGDGAICDELDLATCDTCYAGFRSREGLLERLGLRAARILPRTLPPDLLHRSFAALPGPARRTLKRINERPAPRLEVTAGAAARRRDTLRGALDATDRFVAPSRDMASRMAAWGLDRSRIEVIPNGTPLPRADVPCPGVVDPRRPLSLLFLGTPVAHKGVHRLVEAVERLGGAVRLTIHGHDPAPAYRRRLQGAHVDLAGPLPHRSIGDAIDAADLVCLPSLWPENAPLVLLEARARRRPVLASDIGGVPESAEGLLLPPGAVDAWAEAIGGLARDRGALAALAGRVRPPRTMHDVLGQTRSLYRAVLGSG